MGLRTVARHGLMTDMKVGSMTESDMIFDSLATSFRSIQGWLILVGENASRQLLFRDSASVS